MNDFRPYGSVFWGPREQTFGEFVGQVRAFLLGLREVHPLFKTIYVLGDKMSDEKPLGADLEHLDTLALERSWDKEAPKDWFTHLDEAGRPTADSLVDTGWGFGLVTEPEAGKTSDYAYISMTTGVFSQWVGVNSVLVKVDDPASPLLGPGVLERLLRFM